MGIIWMCFSIEKLFSFLLSQIWFGSAHGDEPDIRFILDT